MRWEGIGRSSLWNKKELKKEPNNKRKDEAEHTHVLSFSGNPVQSKTSSVRRVQRHRVYLPE